MTGYLQRLLDSAAPSGAPSATLSSEAPPGLTPVLRSDSPVFADDQLLGLEAFGDGEAEPELPPAAPDAPGWKPS